MGNHGLNYMFKKLHLNNLQVEVLEWNERSINFYKKLGFKIDLSVKRKYFDGNKYNKNC